MRQDASVSGWPIKSSKQCPEFSHSVHSEFIKCQNDRLYYGQRHNTISYEEEVEISFRFQRLE